MQVSEVLDALCEDLFLVLAANALSLLPGDGGRLSPSKHTFTI